MKRRLRAPSPALVISLIALFVALGGTSLAATKVLAAKHKDAKQDTKLVKKLAPSLSVKHAKTADSATSATHATSADSATNATSAANATNAANATHASTADNASELGGTAAASFVQFGSTLPPGNTETGTWVTAGGSSTSGLEASPFRFYPLLPAALDSSHVIYTTTSTTHCSGVGNADPGYLCVYLGTGSGISFNSIGDATGAAGASTSGGVVYFDITGSGSYGQGHWAVTAPTTALKKSGAAHAPSARAPRVP